MRGDLLTPRQVAERLQVSMPTVYDLISSGRLPAANVGQGAIPRWRIATSALEEYLRQGTATPYRAPATPSPGDAGPEPRSPRAGAHVEAPPTRARRAGS